MVNSEYMVCVLSCFGCAYSATLWTVPHQAPLSVGFSRQESWSGLPLPPPGDLLDPGIEPSSLTSPALTGRFFTASATWEAPCGYQFSSVQFSSVAQSCPTLCDPMNHTTPGLPVHHQLSEFTQTQRPSSQ